MTYIIELVYVKLVYRNIYSWQWWLLQQTSYNLFMVYWSIVMLKVDKNGYYNTHHIAYLWYTGLP